MWTVGGVVVCYNMSKYNTYGNKNVIVGVVRITLRTVISDFLLRDFEEGDSSHSSRSRDFRVGSETTWKPD